MPPQIVKKSQILGEWVEIRVGSRAGRGRRPVRPRQVRGLDLQYVPAGDDAFDVTSDRPAPTPSDLFSDDVRRWTCVQCRGDNDLAADACTRCGTSFGALLGGEPESTVRRLRGASALVKELALLLGLFVLWRVVGSVSILSEHSAFDRGRWLWRLERTMQLPSELSLQQQVLAHPDLVQALNIFYLAAHIGGMATLLIWLYMRHRDRYGRWRNVVVAFTGVALLIQFVSVAPPRLLSGLGFVDTAEKYGQSAYDHLGSGLVDQLSSMPSVHVGWAVIAAVAVIRVSRSRWRWLVVAHPLLTGYAVVVTANHYWLDGVAALALVVAIFGVMRRRDRLRSFDGSGFPARPCGLGQADDCA